MAVSNAARVVQFESSFLRVFRSINVMSQLYNRSREAAMQNRHTLRVPRYKSTHGITENTSFNFDTTRNTPDVDDVTLSWGNILHFNQDIDPDEQGELAPNLLLEYAVSQAADLNEHLDGKLRDQIVAEDVTAVVNDFRKTDTTNQKSVVGTATNYVGYDGNTVAGSTDDEDLFFNKLDALDLTLRQTSKAGSVSVASPIWDVTMPPHLYNNIRHTLENKGVDVLTLEALSGNIRTLLWGSLNLRETNALNKEYTESSKKHHLVIISNRAGLYYGERYRNTRIFPPGINQSGDYYKIDGILQNFLDIVDNRFVYQMYVRKEA